MIPGFCRTRETFRHQPASDYPGARNGTPGFIHLPGWIPRESVTPQTGSRSPPRGLPLALGAFLWPWMVCMPATQEQLQAICHGWSVCLQRRSSCRRYAMDGLYACNAGADSGNSRYFSRLLCAERGKQGGARQFAGFIARQARHQTQRPRQEQRINGFAQPRQQIPL